MQILSKKKFSHRAWLENISDALFDLKMEKSQLTFKLFVCKCFEKCDDDPHFNVKVLDSVSLNHRDQDIKHSTMDSFYPTVC